MRSSGARVLKNTFALVASQVIMVASSFAITVPLARLWGADQFGRYAFVVAFSELFTFSYDWGLNLLLTREVARDRRRVAKYIRSGLGLSLPLSAATLALVALLTRVLGYDSSTALALCLASVWTWLGVLSSILVRGAFHAFERMEYETLPLLAERLFAVVAGLAVILTQSGLISLLLALVASRLISLGTCLAIYARRISPVGVEFDWPFYKQLAKSALPFGLSAASALALRKVDIPLLSAMTGDDAVVGYYRAALTITMYLPLLGHAVVGSLYPIMADMYVSRREAFIRNYRRSVKLLFALGLPMAVGLMLLADRVVGLVYGPEFAASAIAVRILSLSVLLRFAEGSLSMVMMSGNLQGTYSRLLGAAALTNTIVSVVLIPRVGLVGVCVAAVAADLLLLVTSYIIISRRFGSIPLVETLARPVLSAACMAGLVVPLRNAPLGFLIPAAALIYFGVLGLTSGAITSLKGMLAARRRGRFTG